MVCDQSPSGRLAIIADGERYVAALTRAEVAADLPAQQPALEIAHPLATISPEAPAAIGRDVVFAADVRRVPVVDRDGRFYGVLTVTSDRQ